ncbi:MAG TPA: hypothetical protein VJ834_05825 [Burkholderiales bacterium]|nr:hypothetical protein [Burkholderiales bacterium]
MAPGRIPAQIGVDFDCGITALGQRSRQQGVDLARQHTVQQSRVDIFDRLDARYRLLPACFGNQRNVLSFALLAIA